MSKRGLWPDQPPSVFLLRKHWMDLGLINNRGRSLWTNRQVYRLCRMLHCTVQEVGAAVCLKDFQIKRYLKRDCWPAPVALHFLMMTNWYIESQLGVKKPPVIPIDVFVKREQP